MPADGARLDKASRLRLAVAMHFVYAGRVGGAEHMLYNLLRGLWRRDVSLELLCGRAENLNPSFRQEAQERDNVGLFPNDKGGPRFFGEQFSCLAGNHAADAVLFPNYFVPPIVPDRLGAVICVLHDLQYRHIPANFSWRKRLWLRLAHSAAVRRCDRMIVISEFVRQDAIRWLGDRFADRIEVVPNPISWRRFGPSCLPQAPIDHGAPPMILALSAQYEHKNLATLIRAFALLLRRRPDARLVLCGQQQTGLRGVAGAAGDLGEASRIAGVADRVEFTGYIDDVALGRLFREATVFAFPSVFEGFGMPPVEALGFGLPTLTTRCTSLPEVTLGLAHYVENPYDPDEWAARLAAMIGDPAAYTPSASAIKRLREIYSVDRIADGYIDVCRRAAA